MAMRKPHPRTELVTLQVKACGLKHFAVKLDISNRVIEFTGSDRALSLKPEAHV